MKRCFDSIQAREVCRYIKRKYGCVPEYLWARSPSDAVWRRADNEKWFAGIFHVNMDRIEPGAESLRVEILNLRCNSDMTDWVVDKKMIFPGWHMNKRSWITIVLDGRMDYNHIRNLLDCSYVLARGK